MPNIEVNSTPSSDDIEVRQDKFVDNRRIIAEAEARMSNPDLSREEREESVNTILRASVKNLLDFKEDPRVVDKVLDKSIELPRR